MIKPKDQTQIIKGEIADYWLDSDGILYSYSKAPQRTVSNIAQNIELVNKITGGIKPPLLIYLCHSPMPDKETRRYSAAQLPNVYKAMAMVSAPGLGKFIMDLLFRFQKPPIPMKSFSDDKEAREWLMKFL